MMTQRLVYPIATGMMLAAATVFFPPGACGADSKKSPRCRLYKELSLKDYGGVPFTVDLDGDGKTEILWLQSPGIFQSKVYDSLFPKGRFSEAEKTHYCLTATDADGNILWRIGKPWSGTRPFVSHCAERSIDCADIDGDGVIEVVCIRGDEVLVVDGLLGRVERSAKLEADNAQIVVLGKTGDGPDGWTVLVKNSESPYPPHEYANPAWFYDSKLKLLKTADHHGSGHVPLTTDLDGDGLDEFLIGLSLVGSDLKTRWTFQPVPPESWNAGQMHVDDHALGSVQGRPVVLYAASNEAYLVDAIGGRLLWRRKGVHPQHCQVGRFKDGPDGLRYFVHNKRSNLQLYDNAGRLLWSIDPPQHFPRGQADCYKRKKFHVFDPTIVLKSAAADGTDLLVFTDGGWPYLIDGNGKILFDIPCPPHAAQDWGNVPGRADDYGYGFYARAADFDADGKEELLINDRRFAWLYNVGEKN